MAQADLALWITAAATVATALLTGAGSLAAWLVFRRDGRRELPIVERRFYWSDDHVAWDVTLRNRLPEIITLEAVEVVEPRGATIGLPSGPGPGYDPGPPVRAASPKLRCGYIVDPIGTPWSQGRNGQAGFFSFAVWPPAGWAGGKLKVRLFVSSGAQTIRRRRVTVAFRLEGPKPPA